MFKVAIPIVIIFFYYFYELLFASVLCRFECVENAITKVLPHISRARAYDIALHAHTNLKATIMLTWEEKATEVALGEMPIYTRFCC